MFKIIIYKATNTLSFNCSGMDPFDALQAITINPAKHIGIEDRVGSIEAGKDADIIITDSEFNVEKTIIGGEIRYEA